MSDAGFAASSLCPAWTVRQLTSHLVGSLRLLARVAEDAPVDPAEFVVERLTNRVSRQR